jgi:hypothetical protein
LTEKILFWISKDFLHFGVAKSMIEKYDVQSYAIVESNDKPRNFFKTQKIVNFKKTWFFDEEITYSKKQPDIDFLKKIEKEFKINLWLIAYGERQFLHYNKYYKFNSNEILSILEQECKFFLRIIEEIKPSFLVIRFTDFHNIDLITKLCRAKGIKILMLTPSNLNNLWMISESTKIDYIDLQDVSSETHFKNYSEAKIFWQNNNPIHQANKYVENNLKSSKITKNNAVSILRLFLNFKKNGDIDKLTSHGRTKLKIITSMLSLYFKKHLREKYVNKVSLKQILKKKKFIFFALHVEPERSTLIAAPFYTNQLELIKNIAKSLPADYVLYVKEHPIMKTRNWRSLSFYKEIHQLPNVYLLHPIIKNEKIFPNCSMVITISGTIGLEAAFFNKPSLTFSDNLYSHLSFVYRVKKLEDLSKIIKTHLQVKVDLNEFNSFITLLHKNSFQFISTDFSSKKNPFTNNILNNVSVDESTMNIFLKTFEHIFEKLASEHMKKINSHKIYSSMENKEA